MIHSIAIIVLGIVLWNMTGSLLWALGAFPLYFVLHWIIGYIRLSIRGRKEWQLEEMPKFLKNKSLTNWEKGFVADMESNFRDEDFKPTKKQEEKLTQLMHKYISEL